MSTSCTGQIVDGMLVLVPTAPLARNATYTVNFAVTIGDAAPISQSWNFQTGS